MADKVRGFSFGGKHHTGKQNSAPGPGEYTIPVRGIEKRPTVFGTGPARTRSVSAQDAEIKPGPGAYIQQPSWGAAGPSYTMPGKTREIS